MTQTLEHLTTVDTPDAFSPYDLTRHPEGKAVSAAPGDGWLIDITRKNPDHSRTERVVAWIVQSTGNLLPACLDDPNEGTTHFPTLDRELSCRVYHPHAPGQPELTLVAQAEQEEEAGEAGDSSTEPTS